MDVCVQPCHGGKGKMDACVQPCRGALRFYLDPSVSVGQGNNPYVFLLNWLNTSCFKHNFLEYFGDVCVL
jgi:hypothetical protein